jgi:type VI secretion system protein ImpK
MTKGKPQFDSGPDSEKTVIKPNPGGRRDAFAPQTTSTPVGGQVPPSSADIWGGSRPTPGAPAAASPYQPVISHAPLPPQAAATPIDVSSLSVSPTTGGPNPILEAAMPLLLLLANVRIARSVPQVAPMMSTVAQGIETFEATLHGQNIPEPQVRTAKYALCATADDIVQNLPSADRLLWTQYSMLSRYFQVRDSGIGFFDELAKLRQNPQINHNLLGLMHACMSLGFEGKYRVAGGDVSHQQIRRDIYQTLRSREARSTADISPHWRGQDIAAAHVRRAVPLWAVASGAAGLLLLSFMSFRWLLGSESDAAEGQLNLLHPAKDVSIFRVVPTPPPPPPVVKESTQLERIRERLKDDIAQKKLSADYAGKDIVVRLLSDTLFEKGSAAVSESFIGSVGRIALALDKEQGRIRIVGHTDNTPLRSTIKFKDNQDLSEQRAQAVALILVSGVADPRRLETLGVADTAPLDTSDTPEGKSRNRRVEIFIPREDKS